MIETFKLPLFDEDRQIRIYVPENYHSSSINYPVLYMHDGQNVFLEEDAIGGVSLEIHRYLEDNHINLIVVAIDLNITGEERINEYCPWTNGEYSKKLLGYQSTSGGKGAHYVDFIVDQLKPMIDKKYRTLPNETYMAGISLGALISTYAMCCYPQIFKRIAAISAAYYRNQEEIERLLRSSDLSKVERFYLDCGTRESGANDVISTAFL
ncbi:alpha/beta hydrolase [Radiobacillus sp. PE A8.2]|uniref:alpha/beta hydrolase n=1 Tax=Radiobacillus sp. PE A8.2 TaxID=3380349 RepID=UPI00388FF48B